jgi:ribose 5-phosphate isomerase B
MKIAIGCDHVGFELKDRIIKHLEEKNIEYRDFGTYSTERTDYPIYGEAVARAVVSGECEKGILICGTGVGISISANKVPGIRAVVCSEPYSALLSRQHNNTNILAMGSRVVGGDLALMILDAWLSGVYEGGRHQKRVDMIASLEKGISLGNDEIHPV